jgi:hypothetical protein
VRWTALAAATSIVVGACSAPAAHAGPAPITPPATVRATVQATATPPPATATPSKPATTTTGAGGGLSAADRAAGLLSRRFSDGGSGHFRVVPGSAPAPGAGRVVAVRVEVESGLAIDSAAFARFVMATLNDPRSWGHGSRLSFARTTSATAFRVRLASPATSAAQCRPLITFGRLSCRSGNAAVLTMYRWVNGIPDYRHNLTGYRQYVVNHEVGHLLGHGHETCPGAGRLAPVMMQQTKGLMGCRPNPWPFP